MHPRIVYPGELSPIVRDLARPLHGHSLRDPRRRARAGEEADLSAGWRIEAQRGNPAEEDSLALLVEDFRQFMFGAMEVDEDGGGFTIEWRREQPSSCPADGLEAFEVETQPESCRIRARDVDGFRRALFLLEDEMRLRRAPLLPLGRMARWTRIRTRVSRSPIAPYRWMSGWELEDDNDYYPYAYLDWLAHAGINGIWVSGLLRNLVASSVIPELGPPGHRLGKLRALIDKAALRGVRVYLFCIEPRALPDGHAAGLAHPEILGAHRALCPSVPLVLEYAREVMCELFTEVPNLGGVINIFNSERPTTCWLNEDFVQGCPRCRVRPQAEVLAAMLDAFTAGMRDAGSSAEFLAWTYMMDPKAHSLISLPIEPALDVMRASRSDIVWLGNFEHGGTKQACGRTVEVHEYSLSCVGPSPLFVELARAATAAGRTAYAKLQIGTSYELPTVPYVPVPGIAYDKIAALGDLGVRGTMLNWIPGGFPGPMLKAAGEAVFEPRPPKDAFLRRLAAIDWGETRAEAVVAAWNRFERAWQEYPFNNAVLYFGPLARGPAYHLHVERENRLALPYNWGIDRARIPQPFEDQVDRWLGPYSVEELTECFRRMATEWGAGLDSLENALRESGEAEELGRQLAVAGAVRLQCLAAADVYEFYSLRDQLGRTRDEQSGPLLERLIEIGEHSLALAGEMKRLLEEEPALGFHSELYTYSYSTALLDEKTLQVGDMLVTLRQWRRFGIDRAALRRTVAEVTRQRPDRRPDLWGD